MGLDNNHIKSWWKGMSFSLVILAILSIVLLIRRFNNLPMDVLQSDSAHMIDNDVPLEVISGLMTDLKNQKL